ncbi:MAG: hypothetical protein KTR24_13540 [Saprospiraceae bacterium]|nr:hypothetical protein [Saprospiraceae bacterium]
MNTQTSSMRIVSGIIFTVCLLCMVPNEAFSQDDDRLSRAEALRTASNQSRKAGFSQIFFSKSIIRDVLVSSENIRVSSGRSPDRLSVLMIIGLDGSGDEIGDTYLQSNTLSRPDIIDRSTFDAQVAAAESFNRMTQVSSIFSSADLLEMVDSEESNGLMFVPSANTDDDGNDVLTLAVGVASSPRAISDGSTLRRSPCPPDCGDGDQ